MHDNNRRKALLALFAAPAGVAACATASASAPSVRHDDLVSRLDRTEARLDIADILYNYARACDRADQAMMRDCFWPESTHKHGRFDGASSEFVGFAFGIISAMKYTAHHISNPAIEVHGDRAFSECYYMAHHRRDVANGQGEEDVFLEGRYLDLLERRGGVWKIIRRRGLSDFTSSPIPAGTPFASWPAGQHSGRAPSDDYYLMREAFLSAP